jgi:predicted transcriptional regulator
VDNVNAGRQVIRDLPKIRDALGLTTGGLASLLGVDARTVQRYLALEREVPEPTWRLLNLAMTLPAARTQLEHMASAMSP